MTPNELNQPAEHQASRQPGARRSAKAKQRRGRSNACTDQIVGAILSGWRYDISAISPEMRTDYETHLDECPHCHGRQRAARVFDVILISGTTLSMIAFLLAAIVIHRFGMLHGIDLDHVYLPHTAIEISLEAVAIAGLMVSTLLWILIAVATPLPSYFVGVVEERIPSGIRQRFSGRHA